MIENTPSVSEHAVSALRQVGHFVVDVAPYVLLVLIGHTATSIDHHYRDWSWPTYLVSCSSSFLLGIVLFCLVSAFAIPQMVGYALAVLAGRNSRDTLDAMSEDIVLWVRDRIRPREGKENE